ncbi:MAG: cell division protein FtsA [Pseudomonadota bacterium]
MVFNRIRKGNSYPHDNLIAALDVGTSKVCCAIARIDGSEHLRVIGVGHQASKGLRAGNIIDMQDAELSILNAVHLAEQMARETIRSVYVNIGSCQSQSVGVELHVAGHSIDDADIKRLLFLSRQVENPQGQEPIHTIPTSYDIDGRRGIRDPRGMYGEILGVNVHTTYASTSSMRNLSTCIGKCHLATGSFIATPLASGLAALVEDEIELGTIIIDIGAGTTTLGVFFEGEIVHTDSIAVGGGHVTNDIARVLSTPVFQAERLKTLYGSALTSTADEREVVQVPQIGDAYEHSGHQIARADLVRIIRPRIEETFELISRRLHAKGIDKSVGSRVVLTGGASQLPGLQEIATAILDRPVRLGKPMLLHHLHETMKGPAFSTCVGLLAYAHLEYDNHLIDLQMAREPKTMVGRVGNWLRENV